MWNCILLFVALAVKLCHTADFERCEFKKEKYQCTPTTRAELMKLGVPPNACHGNSCDECITVWKTYITYRNELIEPKSFFFQQKASARGAPSLSECKRAGLPCSCTNASPCAGTSEYCNITGCAGVANSTCYCRLVPAVTTLVHEAEGVKIVNPVMISYKLCVASRHLTSIHRRRHQRRLLTDEEAVFQRNDLRLTYNDPIVTLSHPGTLVVRIRGLETVITLGEQPYQATLPPEMLEWSAEMHLIFVTSDGHTLRGAVQIVGRITCNPLQCILCRDLLRQMKCLPATVTYSVYAILILISAITFLYAKTVIVCVGKTFYSIGYVMWKAYRFLRGSTLVAVKTGALAGNALRHRAQVMQQYLERQVAHPINQAPLHGLVLLTVLFLIVDEAASECNAHSIISSKVNSCPDSDTDMSCRLTTNAQITLMNLEHQQCLWFTDESNGGTLFSLKIKFQQVKCDWLTSREYFTHVTSMRYLSQIVCANNPTCNWGKGCVRGKHFEALTKQSLDWPGITGCQPSDSGSTSCWIIDSQHCIYNRIWLEADFLRAYEVRRIVAMQCSYELLIEQQGNATVETVAVRNQATTSTGIRIRVAGALDQPTQITQTHLITRVGNPQESYLERASLPSRPEKGHVGDTQANESMSRSFIFDESMFSCTFYEDDMRCQRQQSYLLTMIETKRNALPFTSAWHQFKIDQDGKLRSELLHSAPVIVNLEFYNYKYTLETRTVCPKFTDSEIQTFGCYACEPLATIQFEAFSSCAAGLVDVHFQTLSIHTRSLKLRTDKATLTIKFKSETRCLKERMCLKARTVNTCKTLEFCLDQPSINLMHPNFTYATWQNAATAKGWDLSTYLSGWSFTSAGILRLFAAGMSALIVVLFLISTLLTCCQR